MPRYYEIGHAFDKAEKKYQNGNRTVTTQDFIAELNRLGWDMSPWQANDWIKAYATSFRDVSTQEGDYKTFQKYNHNGGR